MYTKNFINYSGIRIFHEDEILGRIKSLKIDELSVDGDGLLRCSFIQVKSGENGVLTEEAFEAVIQDIVPNTPIKSFDLHLFGINKIGENSV